MKEIKFRAWHDFSEPYMVYKVERDGASPFDFEDIVKDPELWKLMQYTGCKDKNGKEIYEGDIVKLLVDDGWREKAEQITEIKFQNGAFQVECEGICDGDYGATAIGYLDDQVEVEVLGNIYENPELLPKVGKP